MFNIEDIEAAKFPCMEVVKGAEAWNSVTDTPGFASPETIRINLLAFNVTMDEYLLDADQVQSMLLALRDRLAKEYRDATNAMGRLEGPLLQLQMHRRLRIQRESRRAQDWRDRIETWTTVIVASKAVRH